MDVKKTMEDWERKYGKGGDLEINIRQAMKERGKKHHGFLNVGARADGSPIRLAVSVISGAEKGPILAIDAGVHGDEMEGIEAVIRVVQQLDPLKLRGTVIAVPALNVLGFDAGERWGPSDLKYTAYTNPDLNRVFPGDSEGSVQQRLADIYYRYIIEEADYVISFHGGGNKGIIGNFTFCLEFEGHVGKESIRMAKAFGVKDIWKVSTWPGLIANEATYRCKPTVCPEIGGDAMRYPERAFLPVAINGILNVMRELGMIDGKVERPDSYEVFALEYLKANEGGIFQFHRNLGDKVEMGQVLGETVDLFGSTIETVKAPWSGMIVGVRTYPKVQPGDWIFMLTKGIYETPFRSRQEALGAKIYMVGTWDLPMVYTSVAKEYWAVRKGAGLLDMTSMGKLLVEGAGAEKLIDYLFVNDIKGLPPGRACYTCLCGPDGRMLDDDTVYKFGAEKLLVVTSTANRDHTERWLVEWAERLGLNAKVTNLTQSHGLLALQGPVASKILVEAIGSEVRKLKYFDFCEVGVENLPVIVARTGFTGELGYEIYVPKEIATMVWDRLMAAGAPHGIEPVGLGAVLTLRLEKGYLLWGREIDDTTNPMEAGLGWTIKFSKKGDFVGREALETLSKQGLRRKITGFIMEDKHVIPPPGSPTKGSPIVVGGKTVGHVTSAGFSYLLDEGIGLGYIESEYRDVGTVLEIHVDGVRHIAKVAELPFYDPKGEKLKTQI